MSNAASNYLEDKILNHVLDNTSYTSPTTVYLALYTSNPDEDNSGTEVTGGSYARQSMSFAAASSGSSATDADINFTGMPAATVTHFGILDALTTGNLLYYGAFSSSKTTNSGDTLKVSSGDLTVSAT